MYNVPGSNTGRGWVEVENNSAESIDLGAKTIRLEDSGSSHLIKPYANLNTTLSSGDVAVIAQNPDAFLLDWPSYSGILLKSSFILSAKTTGSIRILQNNGNSSAVLSAATYSPKQGADGDGNSLQLKGTIFVAAAPTPGTVPLVLPAAIVSAPKLSTAKVSSTKRAGVAAHATKASTKKKSKRKSTSHSSYDKGSLAPAASVETDVAGALPISLTFLMPYKPVLSTPEFIYFLMLLAFSAFSLIVLDIHGRNTSTA